MLLKSSVTYDKLKHVVSLFIFSFVSLCLMSGKNLTIKVVTVYGYWKQTQWWKKIQFCSALQTGRGSGMKRI